MSENPAKQGPRYQRLLEKVGREIRTEYETAFARLRERADYEPFWDYFLDLLARPLAPGALREAVDRPLVEHPCNQAPYEIFHALGVHPVRLGSGCFAAGRLNASRLPVLMCPLLKSAAGMLCLHGEHSARAGILARVVPTTCDWVVKFAELSDMAPPPTRYLELPRLRESEKGHTRWQEEIHDLVRFLEQKTGRWLKRRDLLASVCLFMDAWHEFGRLIELRQAGILPGIWFLVIANGFLLDRPEVWIDQIRDLLDRISSWPASTTGKNVFLAGSPILFPNFKLPHLMEEAGMNIWGDDLCTSERLWPGAVCYEEPSVHGLLRALAERYHKACICPVFADNERRIHYILNQLRNARPGAPVRGVIHQVLKGCHPFDIESLTLEPGLRDRGIPFLRIETDYAWEDSRNILTRLEAFGAM